MTYRTRAIAVLLLQCLLVISIAIKFAWERKMRPRVWARAEFVKPDLPLRGRYLNPSIDVDACDLKEYRDTVASRESAAVKTAQERAAKGLSVVPENEFSFWPPVPADVKLDAGRLVAIAPRRGAALQLMVRLRQNCHRVLAEGDMPFFIPDTTRFPSHLKANEELWVEVTMPPQGPPRPIQLAMKRDGIWTPLKLR